MINILVVVIGYLIGSISPAYFFGKVLKGVDIRKVNEKNAGATNVLKTLGIMPAIITALFDISKGLIAFFVAYWMGANEFFIFFASIAAVIGHIFPFYLQFRGGQGAATCTGLLLFFLMLLVQEKSLSMESIIVLCVVVICIFLITRVKEFLALIVMPTLLVMLNGHSTSDLKTFTYIIIVYLFFLSVYTSIKKKIFVLKPQTLKEVLPWRTVMRPVAVVLPIAYFYFDKSVLLWVIGGLCLPFLIMDLIRLASGKINIFFFDKIKFIYKSREKKRFSSITLFFLSMFLTILLFDKSIAIVAICFLIFGDLFAKFFGLEYGKIKIFGNKTLEGSIGHFVACFLVAFILSGYVGLPFSLLAVAAIFASLIEALPLGVNDNFTVSLASSLFLVFAKKFF